MKKLVLSACFVFLYAAYSATGYAGEPDAASTSALMDTQKTLENRDARKKAIDQNPMAQSVDAQVTSLAGNSENADELYKISGKVLEDIVKETGGDPVKMMEVMSKVQADPKTLVDHLSDQNKAALHSVASKIENAPTTVNRQPASDK